MSGYDNNPVEEFTPAGAFVGTFGDSGAGQLSQPYASTVLPAAASR